MDQRDLTARPLRDYRAPAAARRRLSWDQRLVAEEKARLKRLRRASRF